MQLIIIIFNLLILFHCEISDDKSHSDLSSGGVPRPGLTSCSSVSESSSDSSSSSSDSSDSESG